MATMRVLTWNLYHGRAVPPAGRDLQPQFAAALAGWDWDVALLQEVPPWWPPALARACDAAARSVPTSRNALLALRRFVAERAPDLIRSNGGGANAILVRATATQAAGAGVAAAGAAGARPAGAAGARAIVEHRSVLLRRWPERRVCHAVALADGTWVANLHAQVHSVERAQADIERAAAAVLAWAGGAPALLGGDFNVRDPIAPGFEYLGGHGVDHVLGHGLRAAGAPQIPDHGRLSDHAPVIVTVLPQSRTPSG
jgi:endonuclease/exonuclease/phosphatase family metal-dependent hydrolase